MELVRGWKEWEPVVAGVFQPAVISWEHVRLKVAPKTLTTASKMQVRILWRFSWYLRPRRLRSLIFVVLTGSPTQITCRYAFGY